MKIVIDMNLSPEWCRFLTDAGYEAIHWSSVGLATAPDTEIMAWAETHNYLVFKHDLDFGAILAATNAEGPSVLQVRTLDVVPAKIGMLVLTALVQFSAHLAQGALITVDERNQRARILPIRQ